jgi:hypothetical protein
VHAVLAKLGIPVPCSDLFGAFGLAWLDALDLPQPYAGVGDLVIPHFWGRSDHVIRLWR